MQKKNISTMFPSKDSSINQIGIQNLHFSI